MGLQRPPDPAVAATPLTRLGRAALSALAVISAVAVPAVGHEEVAGVTNVLDSVEPPPPAGVTVHVTRSIADQLVAQNSNPKDLEVLGDDGQPFLRIGPRGVTANFASADWHRSNAPEGAVTLPEEVGGPARWVQVSADDSWGWFDHRLHRVALVVPPEVEPGRSVVLERWEVPMRVGDGAFVARGRRLFERPAGVFRHEVVTQIPGTRATVLAGKVPALFLTAPDTTGLELVGHEGEPFARFGATGVEVNEASPTWALTARSRGSFDPGGQVGAGEVPRWRRERSSPELTWLEPRARPTVDGEDHEWSVPGRIGGDTHVLRGRSVWVPTEGSDSGAGSWRLMALGLGLAVAMIPLGVGVRRRRRAQRVA